MEEPQTLMRPESHERIKTVNRLYGLVDGEFPARELSRRVNIVWLDLGGEARLVGHVDVDLSLRKLVRVLPDDRSFFQHCAVKGSVNLN